MWMCPGSHATFTCALPLPCPWFHVWNSLYDITSGLVHLGFVFVISSILVMIKPVVFLYFPCCKNGRIFFLICTFRAPLRVSVQKGTIGIKRFMSLSSYTSQFPLSLIQYITNLVLHNSNCALHCILPGEAHDGRELHFPWMDVLPKIIDGRERSKGAVRWVRNDIFHDFNAPGSGISRGTTWSSQGVPYPKGMGC